MGDFSRDTFDKLKHYVGVRMQQGVPLLDADWNEQEDIKKYELRAFLKWFVGSGVPKKNDGFRIVGENLENDFIIKGGTPDAPGYCLVDGWDVMIEQNINYTAQQLYDNDDLAGEWEVDTLGRLSPPLSGERTDTVYLDVWEREVDRQEDENLVNPAIDIETCVRLKREWVVRVAEGSNENIDLIDYLESKNLLRPGHAYYPLASLKRFANKDAIEEGDITDLRMTELSVVSQKDVRQIVTDAYGSSYTLDHDGQPNLKVSLRDAVNAILRGTLPGTLPEPLTHEALKDTSPHALEDSNGNTWVFWQSNRVGSYDIWYNRRVNGTWEGDTQLTTDPGHDTAPFALEDRNGVIWVFWKSYRAGNYDIWYNRCVNGTWEGETQFTTDTEHDECPIALGDRNGTIWVFWCSSRAGNYNIWYNRRVNGTWGVDTQLTTTDPGNDFVSFALEDRNGAIWVFWRSDREGNLDIWYNRRVNGTWEGDTQLTTDTGRDYSQFALEDRNGDIWVFWQSDRAGNHDIWYNRWVNGTWEGNTQLTTDPGSDITPFALEDRNGTIWVFWCSSRAGNYAIWYNRCVNGIWQSEKQLSAADNSDGSPFALEDSNGDIQVFWPSYIAENCDIWHSSLIPRI